MLAEIDWYHSRPLSESEHLSMCQCAGESLIRRQLESRRMRSFLIVGVFFDRLVHDRFSLFHQDFERAFKIPKINSHNGDGQASAVWLMHQIDNADWVLIESLVAGALSEVLYWTQERLDVSISEFENIVREAITNEFKSENQERLVQAFQVDFEKDALTYDAFGDA